MTEMILIAATIVTLILNVRSWWPSYPAHFVVPLETAQPLPLWIHRSHPFQLFRNRPSSCRPNTPISPQMPLDVDTALSSLATGFILLFAFFVSVSLLGCSAFHRYLLSCGSLCACYSTSVKNWLHGHKWTPAPALLSVYWAPECRPAKSL